MSEWAIPVDMAAYDSLPPDLVPALVDAALMEAVPGWRPIGRSYGVREIVVDGPTFERAWRLALTAAGVDWVLVDDEERRAWADAWNDGRNGTVVIT